MKAFVVFIITVVPQATNCFHTVLGSVHVFPSNSLFVVYILDAILNMVNNIAANVLGATPELEGGTESEGTDPSDKLNFPFVPLCVTLHVQNSVFSVVLIDQNITAEK